MKKKIAIIGASGYIGKSLVHKFSQEQEYEVFLFVRSKEKMINFLHTIEAINKFEVNYIADFENIKYDAVINCTGVGKPSDLTTNPANIFAVTEQFDNLILEYLQKNKNTLYINFSSGAVYPQTTSGDNATGAKTMLDINNLRPSDYYAIAKINAEAKHRAMPDYNIVDLRIFSFFSRFVDIQAHFLMSDIIGCIKDKTTLKTSEEDIIRDYVCPDDLYSLIRILFARQKINDVFDVYSLKPVSKFELLYFLRKKYALDYEIKSSSEHLSPTGQKNAYFSKNRKAADIGYVPKHTSLSGIGYEMDAMIWT